MKCPICEEGCVTEVEGTNKILYNGSVVAVHFCHSLCDACGSEFATTKQVTRNKSVILKLEEK
jgi:C4-type Zn-finger protein